MLPLPNLRLRGQGIHARREEGQLISLDLPNVDFFPYLVEKRDVAGSYTLTKAIK